jgi:hypothetical protein
VDPQVNEVKQIASTLLAAMLSNPHVYSQVSDEGVSGQLEQKLIIIAVEMATSLIQRIEAN